MHQEFDITFVTCEKLAGLDPDDGLCLDILRQRGWRTATAVWNDPDADWERAGLTVLRSTWDYHLSVDRFIGWAETLGPRLLNKFSLVRWNSNKRYLIDLQNKGVSVIPTMAVSAAELGGLEEALNSQGWSDVIVKPSVGLSTFGVKRFRWPDQLAELKAHVAELSRVNDVLLQRYMPAVDDYGERALMFFDGQYSHSVRKTAFQKLAVAGEAGETRAEASASEIAFGTAVLSKLPEVPVYARVDTVPDADGRLFLMELELIEPSMFLTFDACAPGRFADVLERRLRATGSVPALPSTQAVFGAELGKL